MMMSLLVLLTGCVKFNASLNINSDKSMDFNIIYAIDTSIFQDEEMQINEEDFAELKNQGFNIEEYSEGTMKGFTLSRKFENIDLVSTTEDVVFNLSGMADEKALNPYMFKVVKGDDKNTYYAKFRFDSNDSGLNDDNLGDRLDGSITIDDDKVGIDGNISIDDYSDDSSSDIDMPFDGNISSLMSNLDLSFKVNLPYSAISSNATTKEDNDKKLTWLLVTNGEEYMEFAFEIPNNTTSNIFSKIGNFFQDNMMLIIAIGGALLLIIIIILLVALISQKKKINSLESR